MGSQLLALASPFPLYLGRGWLFPMHSTQIALSFSWTMENRFLLG
jgi:hypothetical protein